MAPFTSRFKNLYTFKTVVLSAVVVLILICSGLMIYSSMKKDVVLICDGKEIAVQTIKSTVKEVLDENSIKVQTYDYVSLPFESKLQKIAKNIICIKRAVPIKVVSDGKEVELMTYRDTVEDALANSKVKLLYSDKIEGAKRDDKIVAGMKVKVVRVSEEIFSETKVLPFNLVTRENDRLNKGVQTVLREGKQGLREKSFKVVLEDGKEVARKLISDIVTQTPIDKLVECGTIMNRKISRGDLIRYKQVLNMSATAYTGSGGFEITATGIRAHRGVIAVDPRIIPLGTRVYVEGGGSDYGYAVAADTGGAIKGKIIDLYFDDYATVKRWGRRNVTVYILRD